MIYVFVAILIVVVREFITFVAWARLSRANAEMSLIAVNDDLLREIQFGAATSIPVVCSDVFALYQTVRLRSSRREFPAVITAKTDINITVSLI